MTHDKRGNGLGKIMTAANLILMDVDGEGVATLTLNRPESYNAFTLDMIQQWHVLLKKAAATPEIKAIVLTGAGKAFCAGGDAGAMQKRAGNESLERKDFLWRHVHKIALEMDRLDKPVIAAINGIARGAGLDMALMCDMRVMAQSTTVAESYISMGLIAGDGGSYYLPRLIGLDRALDLLWTGRAVESEEALRIGLVTSVVADELVLSTAQQMARRIVAQPTEAVRYYKRAVYQGLKMSLASHLDMISSHMAVLRDTAEHRSKVAQFLQRKSAPPLVKSHDGPAGRKQK